MKKVTVKATTTVRRVGNRMIATTRVSNGPRTKTFTKSVRLPR